MLNPFKIACIFHFFCYNNISQIGPLAQLAEHVTFNHGVPGSSLGWITKPRQAYPRQDSKKRLRRLYIRCTFSSVGRATDS